MENRSTTTYTVFADFERHIFTGTDLAEAVDHGKRAYLQGGIQTVVVFDDATGDRSEIDSRPDAETACAWLARLAPKRAGPGRPKLGVICREISLLPRQWAWLEAQPGTASGTLRRLIDEARKQHSARDLARAAKDAACKFMSVVGGDRPGFEAATRALYAGDFEAVRADTASWPADLGRHLEHLVGVAADLQRRVDAETATRAGGDDAASPVRSRDPQSPRSGPF